MCNTVIPRSGSQHVPMFCLASLQTNTSASEGVEGEICPTWFLPVRSASGSVSCECGDSLGGIVRCDHRTKSTQLLSTHCMATTYSDSNGTTTDNHGQVVGQCPYNYYSDAKVYYVTLPTAVSQINDYTCGVMNRTGLLCAHCKDGLGPAVISYERRCLECLNSLRGWLLYAILACFPTTLFFLYIMVFKVRGTSPSLNVIVFTCQLISTASRKHALDSDGTNERVLKSAIFTIAGFWNLDFFRYVIPPFCVSSKMTVVHALALDYVVAVYPLFLIIAIYIAIELHARDCRVLSYTSKLFSWCVAPCKKSRACVQFRRWDPQSSIIHTFSTFLLLSYSKSLYISFNLLASTQLYDVNGTKIAPRVVYYDASVKYLSGSHRPFAFLAILVLSTVVAIPLLILLLYPTRLFQKCLGCCRVQWHPLHAFVDTFQGYYKNGTNETRDCRSFSAIYLILRILYMYVFANHTDIHYKWIVIMVCPGVASLLFALTRPYKSNKYNVLDSIFLAMMALYGFWVLYRDTAVVITVPYKLVYAASTIPLLYIVFFVSYKVLKWLGVFQKCQRKMRSLGLCPTSVITQEYEGDGNSVNEWDRVQSPAEHQPLLSSTGALPLSGVYTY